MRKTVARGIQFGHFALDVANSIKITPLTAVTIRQWTETCSYVDEVDKDIVNIIVQRGTVDLQTVHLLEPNFKKIADALATAEGLFFDFLPDWIGKH